jgi:hypothetical protein
MGRANPVQASWTKGEVSPLAAGRVDVSLYSAGAEVIENLIVRPQGPLFRRSGTKYVNSTKVPANESVLVPFEVSDEQAYMLEFGKGYIRFFKSKEPLFETTKYEVEAFTLETDSGLMRLVTEDVLTVPTTAGTEYGDLPTYDISCVSPVNDTTDGYQVTTSIPHTYHAGSLVLIYGTSIANLNGAMLSVTAASGEVTVAAGHNLSVGDTIAISGYGGAGLNGIRTIATVTGDILTFTGISSFVLSATMGNWCRQVTVTTATTRTFKFQLSTGTATTRSATGFAAGHGLIAGDKFYVSGATALTNLSERHFIAKSVATSHKWTVANLDYAAGAPSGEEAHVIPIEIETNYGFGQSVTVTSTASYFTGVYNTIEVTTSTAHGYTTGDTVLVNSAGSGVDGLWQISVTSTTKFVLSTAYYVGATTGGTVRKQLTASEFSIKDLKFAQSADVLYITHPLYPPAKLVRLDDDGDRNDWLLADASFRDGPYMGLNDLSPNINSTTPQDGAIYPDVYMEVSSYAHTATVKSAVAFAAAAADDGKYIEWKEGDQWRLALVNAGSTSLTSHTVTVLDNVMLGIDQTTVLKSAKLVKDANYVGYGARGKSSPAGYYSRSGAYLGRINPDNEVSSASVIGAAPLSVAGRIPTGTITSQYSNTFSAGDVGKYIRIKSSVRTAAGHWVQITKLEAGSGSGATSNKATHGNSLTMASNNDTGKFVVSAHSRTCTLTAKKAGAVFAAFSATDIGRSVRLGFAGRWTWGKITGYTSTSVVTITLYEDMPRDPNDSSRIAGNQDGIKASDGTLPTGSPDSGITYDWRMGAWSHTTGFPACVVFHEQRLTFGATSTEPQTFWMSTSGDFENMSPTELDSTVLDDSAIAYELASAKANPIRWLVSGSALGIGTAGGEWQVKSASSINNPITPSSISAKEYTTHGAGSRIQPAKIGSSVLFVDRSKRKVHELFYSYQDDAVVSDELTVISEHILREHTGAVAAAFQQKPHSIYWIVCGDGTLSAVTFNKKQEVVAWHHHTIAGATVEWISTIPSSDGTEDEVWMVCKRTVNSAEYRTIEVLESDFYPASAVSRAGMRFQDGHILLQPTTATFTLNTITGLNWLAGQTVAVTKHKTDYTFVYETAVVSAGGEITPITTTGFSEITIGVNGNADVGSLPPEGGSPFGNSQGQQKKLIYLDVRFLDTMNVSYGPNSSSLVSKTLTPATGVWFSKTERLVPNNGWDVESKYYIRQAYPYPLNILMVVAKLETNE